MENTVHKEPLPQATALTMAYVLTRIDRIIEDRLHITDALEALTVLSPPGMSTVEDGRGQAVAATVREREETNRAALRLLERMYGDLQNPMAGKSTPIDRFERIMKALENWDMDEDYIADLAKKALDLQT